MGYTHYWKIKDQVDVKKYNKAIEVCALIAKEGHKSGILADGSGEEGTAPIIKQGEVGLSFNGIEDNSHETFFLPSSESATKERLSDFCKTARKDYDIYVTACLVALHNILGDDIEVSSDGDAEEFLDGLKLARNILGVDLNNIDQEPVRHLAREFIEEIST
jgi:hypothetical protein